MASDVLHKSLKIKLMDFGDTAGAPSQAVVQLVKQAYEDGSDYFFQCNDDTVRLERRRASFRRRAALISLASQPPRVCCQVIVSKGWADSFIAALSSNPVAPNLGITGPVDTNNDRIITHAFAHRTHVEIFDGRFFPAAFNNW